MLLVKHPMFITIEKMRKIVGVRYTMANDELQRELEQHIYGSKRVNL